MSKTIQDYREIVKVLKLQLLKVREQNNSLSKALGIANQNQTSSFTPRLEKLAKSSKQFAKHWFLFSLFAHKCQIIGVTPQMVFRIADKKRDKKVGVGDLTQIMKRLKLKLDDVQISRLLGSITKSGNIIYDQYLQYMNAFQINSEQYPPKNPRTYSQICLLKFGESIKQNNIQIQNLFREITKQTKSYINFQEFASYSQRNTKLQDVQIICIFITLDPSSECLIQKDTFMREMNKINNLIEKGVSYEDNKYQQRQQKQQKQTKYKKKKSEDFQMQQETGVEAGQKKKQPKKQNKISKGDLNNLVQELKKQGISVSNLITKLLQKQDNKKFIRPYSLIDFSKTIQDINRKLQKKKILQIFKCLDSSSNGSASTDQLVKLWLQGKQLADTSQSLFKLLARHFKQIQVEQYITKFNTCGFDKNDIIDSNMLSNVFSGMNLRQDYLKLIIDNHLPNKCTVGKFVQLLQTGGIKKPSKGFEPMKKIDYQNMSTVIKKLLSREEKRFPKISRQLNADKDSSQKQYWDTIFTDEWACWNYCLQTAYKLTGYWRDPQFGPSKGDPNGFRSIVGNQSQIPPGLPCQDQITWLSFEQMLQRQGKNLQQVKLFSDNLIANDIAQGRLGDCWFVSSLSIITSNDEFVKGKSISQCKVRPQTSLSYGIHPVIFHCFRKYGIYVFKFFKSFKPVYVVVDELFPVQISTNQLIFAKSPTPGIQWVAFVQKSYTKLHHCYTNMISGDISQGLSDLTNTLPVKQPILSNKSQDLLQKMIKLSSQKQLMGCSINAPSGAGVQQPVTLDDERTGLFYGHAYSIGDFIDLKSINKQDYKLMRVRNPWGHGQWLLDWSDKPSDPDYSKLQKYQKDIDKFYEIKINQAKSMKQNYQQITKYRPGQDGQFLINFNDFAKIYSNLFISYNLKGRDYKNFSFQGKWNKQTPSGLCKAKGASQAEAKNFVRDNYQFVVQVKQKTDILMFLIQQDGRLFRGQKYPYKQVCNGIIILSFNLQSGQKYLQKFDNTKMTLPSLKLQLKRQTNYWHKFEAGKYAIFPCKMQNKIPQAQFQFRIYAEKDISIKKINGGGDDDFKILTENNIKNSSDLQSMVDFVIKNADEKKK